jgi:hypothetical protein
MQALLGEGSWILQRFAATKGPFSHLSYDRKGCQAENLRPFNRDELLQMVISAAMFTASASQCPPE